MRLDVANRAVVATLAGSAKVRRIDDGRRSSSPTHGHTQTTAFQWWNSDVKQAAALGSTL
jgi:hypothetical protein